MVKTKSKLMLMDAETDGEQKREHKNGARKRKIYQRNKSIDFKKSESQSKILLIVKLRERERINYLFT